MRVGSVEIFCLVPLGAKWALDGSESLSPDLSGLPVPASGTHSPGSTVPKQEMVALGSLPNGD